MIALCVVTFLSFIATLVHLRVKHQTSFDRFQMFSVMIFLFLVVSTLVEGSLEIIKFESYEKPETQLFECINISLFFLFVDSMFYRMRALQEGDNFIIRQAVEAAREKVFR
jgi:hypothetical protein